MTRVVAALATVVAAAVLVVVLVPVGTSRHPPHPFVARAGFSGGVHLFADDVTASVEIVGDRRRVDPAGAKLHVSFAPYDVVSHTSSKRAAGGAVDFRYTFTLRCITVRCMPKELPTLGGTSVLSVGQHQPRGSRRTFRFAAARLAFVDPRTHKRVTRAVRLPPLQTVSRLSDAVAYGQFPFRFDAAPLPRASTRGWIVPLLLAALVLLLCVPGGLVALRVRERLRARERRLDLPPLERALVLIERTAKRGDEAGLRSALELLADAIDGDVGRAARRLAWSSATPSRDEATRLAEAARA